MKVPSRLLWLQFLILSLFATQVLCAAINPPPGLIQPSNSTHRPDISQLGLPEYHCTRSPRWLGKGADRYACGQAVDRFFEEEVQRHGYIDYEFTAPGATPTVHDRPELTPRRYEAGLCLPSSNIRTQRLNSQGLVC